LFIDTGDFALEVPESKNSKYMKYEGKEVIFGIRPEDIHNPEFAPPGIHAAPVEAKVDVTELMGNEIILHMMSGESFFIARVDPRTRFSIGAKVQVVFNMDNFHIFDPSMDSENPIAVR